MKIGIDIDGVLTDEHTYVLDNGTKYFSENNISYIVNRSVYDSEGIFGVSEDEYNESLDSPSSYVPTIYEFIFAAAAAREITNFPAHPNDPTNA